MISVLKRKYNKKGFTLAELLVVVAIIAILVAIAIPMFDAATTKAYKGVAEANARSAYGEWMVEFVATGTPPAANSTITYTMDNVTTVCTLTGVDKDNKTMTVSAAVGGQAAQNFTFSYESEKGTT